MASTNFSGQDIQALASKLREWGKTLSEQEQAILGFVIDKAVSLTDAELDGVAGGVGLASAAGLSNPVGVSGQLSAPENRFGRGTKLPDHAISQGRRPGGGG